MSIASYKKSKKDELRKKRNANFAEEREQEAKANEPKKDERLFTIGKEDEPVIIRFLPQGESDRIPRVKFKMHWLIKFVNGKKKILSWKCRKTLGEDEACPSDDRGSELWIDGATQQENEKARMYYRKDQHAANVLIVDDPNNPENNGKIFIFKFGKTIDKMIQKKITPKVNKKGKITKEGVDIFCPVEGLNFTLDPTVQGDNCTYKDSEFEDDATVIASNDKDFNRILKACYNLDEIFLDEASFLSAEEVQKRFDKFETGQSNVKLVETDVLTKEEVDVEDDNFDYDNLDDASDELTDDDFKD
jgi:hypothetical protein